MCRAQRAIELLQLFREEKRKMYRCLHCGSDNIEYISTPRKTSNWLGALLGFFFGNYAVTVDKVFHCFNCGKEFSEEEMDKNFNMNASANDGDSANPL